jgi:hypothetical protein
MFPQRFMMGYGRWCEMPELDDEAVEELHAIFSDDAVRQNAYEISTHWDNDDVDETLRNLDREWQRAVKIRIDEVRKSTHGTRTMLNVAFTDSRCNARTAGRSVPLQCIPT